MKNPFRRRHPQEVDEEGYYLETPKKKETLMDTANRIIQRKMKKDPDGYGIIASEKLKGISREEPKTMRDFFQELAEYNEMMDGAGLGRGKDKSMIREFLEALPAVAEILGQIRGGGQGQLPKTVVRVEQPAPSEQIDQGRTKVRSDPQVSQPKLDVKIETLLPLLALDAQTAWDSLRNDNQQGWINYLSTTSLEETEAFMRKYAEDSGNPEYIEGIDVFLAQNHQWLQDLIIIAHNSQGNEQK